MRLSQAFIVSACIPVGQNRSMWFTHIILGVPAFMRVAPYLMFWVMGVSISSSFSSVSGDHLGKSRSSWMIPSMLSL